jgi:hypothetical protein
MQIKIYSITRLALLAALLLIPVQKVAAMPPMEMSGITCHCFTDRSYDPERPTLADPYFLANAQNSFFAAAFKVEKREIVIKKQKGVSAEDLWASHWLAVKSGRDAEVLLKERPAKGSWRQVAAGLSLPAAKLGPKVADALKRNGSDQQIAQAVLDQLLVRTRFHTEADLGALRKAGAGNQEVVLSALLASKIRQPALQLYKDVKNGSASWGSLLQRAKIEPGEIQSEVTALVRLSGDPLK